MLAFIDLVNCVKGSSLYDMFYGTASTLSQLAQLCQAPQQVLKSIIVASLCSAEQTGSCTVSGAASTATSVGVASGHIRKLGSRFCDHAWYTLF